MKASWLCVIAFIASSVFTPSTAWEIGSRDARWKMHCDFQEHDIGRVESPGEQCSDRCFDNPQCTHFTYWEGFCYMKRTQGKLDEVHKQNAVCGFIPGRTSSETENPGHSGHLKWKEEFDGLDRGRWKHLITGWRGGNNEFQYYTDRKENSYVRDGILYIKPTLTVDRFGHDFLYNGVLDLNQEGCNLNLDAGCRLTAGHEIINPIQSARMVTSDSFSFTYGVIEVRAKMPKGDWLWPAIWMLPTDSAYGGWPRSGEIDIVETRGNADFSCHGSAKGRQLAEQTLHWGPDPNQNAFTRTNWQYSKNNPDFASAFHTYRVEWRPDGFKFSIDNHVLGTRPAPAGGFWEFGRFGGDNIWKSGSRMAPFDKRFHFVVNLAVGGNFFPDGCNNAGYQKPWSRDHPQQMRKFWESRNNWLPTWNPASEDSALQIDWIRVYEL